MGNLYCCRGILFPSGRDYIMVYTKTFALDRHSFAAAFQPRTELAKLLPACRFVVLGTGGSHLLGELLRRTVWTTQGRLPQSWMIRTLLDQRQLFPLHYIQRCALETTLPLFGFQVSVSELLMVHRMAAPQQFMQRLYHQGYRIIHLQQQDLLRYAIALLKATTACPRPRIHPARLLSILQQLEEQRLTEAAMVAQLPHLSLTYETELLDPGSYPRTVPRLGNFLHLDCRLRPPYPLRLVHQRLADLVSNYDELCTALAASDYAYLLAGPAAIL